MKELPSDPRTAAWVALVRASAGVISAVQAEVKAAGFPPLEWYDVLWDLERAPHGARRPFELEGRLLLAQYNLSRLIDRLARAGYLEKAPCPVDGRGQMVRITEEGRALRKRMWSAYGAAIQRHMGALTEAEAMTMTELLVRLAENARCGGVAYTDAEQSADVTDPTTAAA